MDDQRRAYRRLKEMAGNGRLQSLCDEYGIELLVVFGSAVRDSGRPARDLDLAFRLRHEPQSRLLGFIDALTQATGTDALDFMNLDQAAPVAREQALAYGEALFERRRGDFARAQMTAISARMDTEWVRELQRRQLTQWQ
ncbi:nucleotidyltransferase domain-containing protein [Glycomyces sp. A-F 0318]|uniref:nucleotidyltransferase family protein n=1 Tax=Glycomyces amatae TaxID=2881355 RepID=UPI001E330E12|nr:nucleotidyltransferase domain-containing protein [Glycomyces amatae]MCD0444669.1 nucleotidyltransferase domain-containing protein [Glycomyces amatae]